MDRTRNETHTWAVSMWVIPNGADYGRAWVRKLYFTDEEAAKEYAKRHEDIPEMAVAYKLKEHEITNTTPNNPRHL